MTNPFLKIVQDNDLFEVGVFRADSLNLLNVGLDERVVVANGLNKEQLASSLDYNPLI